MCSSRGTCGGNTRSSRSSGSEGTGSGAHYALCALGVGLIALGIVMIVWTVIPMDGESSGSATTVSDNSTAGPHNDDDDEDGHPESAKSSTVAMVLVGVGAALLLLSLFLGVRNKRQASARRNQPVATGGPLLDHVAGQPGAPAVDPHAFSVPSYEEVVGSDEYPVRQSNLRQSTSQLPSYEDIIAAVENEGAEPNGSPTQDAAPSDPTPASARPAEPQADADAAGPTSNPSLPTRSTSRASRLLRPLRVRRIKSDKLHLKDFRIQIRSPTHNPVTIEPITPPPQYENKMPELE